MSGGNCPETPRQKMIAMMYLVLTAMLAINVAPEVLEGFHIVNQGLESTNKNFEDRNKLVYDILNTQEQNNKKKVEDLNLKAKKIRMASDSLVAVIAEYKDFIATKANNNIPIVSDSLPSSAFSDQEASAQMLSDEAHPARKSDALYKAYYTYKESVKDIMNGVRGGSEISNNIDKIIKVKSLDDRKSMTAWEVNLFEARPVITSLTFMTQLQNDVRNVETVSIQHIFSQIGATDLKVNRIRAIIKPKSAYIIQGDVFDASVIIAAVDTTQVPSIIQDNKPLQPGQMSYQIPTKGVSPGIKTTKVRVGITNSDGEVTYYSDSLKYQVVEPSATVSAMKMNVFYDGVVNPVKISVPGVSDDKVNPVASNGSLVRNPNGKPGEYTISPKVSAGSTCTIRITADIDGNKMLVGESLFRVKLLPDPVPYLLNGNNIFYRGRLSRDVLLNSTKLFAKLKDAEFDAPFSITSFAITFTDAMGNTKLESSSGANFTETQKAMLRKLKKGASVTIGHIMSTAPDGSDRKLSPMEIDIN